MDVSQSADAGPLGKMHAGVGKKLAVDHVDVVSWLARA